MDDESGASVVSLVEQPAIEVDWFAFDGSQKKMYFEQIDEQKLAGPFMIPDVPIYRNDEGGEYNLKFSKETVQKMAEKFNRELYGKNVTREHSGEGVKAYVIENWIVENPDKSKKYGFSLPEGTWFGVIKVEDAEFWQEFVRTGKLRGFSIEAMLGMTREMMGLVPEKNQFNKMTKEFAKAKLTDGTEVSYEALEVGMVMNLIAPDGAESAAPDGEYTLEDGTVIVVEAGVIASVTPKEEATPDAPLAAEVEASEQTASGDAEKFQAMQDAFAALESRIAALEANFKASSEENEKLKEQVAEFAKQPGAKSVTLSVEEPASKMKMSFEDKLARVRKLASK